jgi:hypothetical protein
MTTKQHSIILEIQYFAPIQYYCKLLGYNNVIIEDSEHYSKGSFRNRCMIAMSNSIHSLSIPLASGKNQQADIRNVRPDNSQPWQKNHFRSIRTAYGSAPYFEHYEERLYKLFEKKYQFLFDLCLDIQSEVCSMIKLKCESTFSNEYKPSYNDTEFLDFRNKISPKTCFDFVWDNEFSPAAYPQIFEERNGFLPNLSILDLLLCTGPEAIYYLNRSIIKS